MNDKTDSETRLYVHLSSNGEVFIIADDVAKGIWGDMARFKAELHRLKETDGLLLVSMDEDLLDEGTPLKILVDLINSFGISVRDVPKHPAVNGYSKSFSRALWDAVDLAREDIEGTKGLIGNTEYWLTQSQKGSSDYRFWEAELERLGAQLKWNENAHKKLSDLEFELTNDAVGGEN